MNWRILIPAVFWGGLFLIFKKPWLLVVGLVVFVLNLALMQKEL